MMERDSGSHRDSHKKHDAGDHTGHYQHSDMSSGEQWAQPHKKARLVDADTQAQYMDRNVLQPPRYQPQLSSQLSSDKVDSAVQYSPTEVSFVSQTMSNLPVFPNMNMMNNSFYGFTNTGGHFNAPGGGGFYGFPPHSLGNFGLGKNDLLPTNVSAPSSTQTNASVNTTESGGLNNGGGGGFSYFTSGGQSSQAGGVEVQTQSQSQSHSQNSGTSTSISVSTGTQSASTGTHTHSAGTGSHSINTATQSHSTGTGTDLNDTLGSSSNSGNSPSSSSGQQHHKSNKPRTFHCPQCSHTYTRADHLSRHFKKKHMGQVSPPASSAGPSSSPAFKYYGSASLSVLNGSGKERKPEGPKQFFCMVCNNGFTRRDHLSRHMKRQHPTDNSTNASCQTPSTPEFSWGCGFKSGEGASQVPKPFHCPDCTSSFTRVDHLTRHLKTQKIHFHTAMQIEKEIGKPNKPVSYHPCPLCGKMFTRQDHMKRHQKIHARGEPVKCGECQMWFPEKGQLNQHMLEAHHIQVFECCYCSKSFYECEYLTKHLKEKHNLQDAGKAANGHLGIAEPRYRCGICTLQFNKESECTTHMLHHVVPTGSLVAAIPFATSQANDINTAAAAAQLVVSNPEMWSRFSSSFQTGERGGQYTSNGINVPQFPPPQSQASKENAFSSQSMLFAMAGQSRDKGDNHPNTSGSFSPASSVTTHEMSCQAESGQFLCGVCGSSFTKNSDLKQHIKRHANDRPHGCHDCGATFSSASNLQRHRHTHTGQRPFKCPHDACESAFTHKGALINHERIHTGERPYVCHLCDATFTRKDALDRHKKTHKENRIKQEREMSTSTDDLDFPPLH